MGPARLIVPAGEEGRASFTRADEVVGSKDSIKIWTWWGGEREKERACRRRGRRRGGESLPPEFSANPRPPSVCVSLLLSVISCRGSLRFLHPALCTSDPDWRRLARMTYGSEFNLCAPISLSLCSYSNGYMNIGLALLP